MKKIFKLCRGKGCCPEFSFDFDSVGDTSRDTIIYTLADDYENSIKFSSKEFSVLLNDIENSLKENVGLGIVDSNEQVDFTIKLLQQSLKMKYFQLEMLKDIINDLYVKI